MAVVPSPVAITLITTPATLALLLETLIRAALLNTTTRACHCFWGELDTGTGFPGPHCINGQPSNTGVRRLDMQKNIVNCQQLHRGLQAYRRKFLIDARARQLREGLKTRRQRFCAKGDGASALTAVFWLRDLILMTMTLAHHALP